MSARPEKRKAPGATGAEEKGDTRSLRLDELDRNPDALNFDDEDAVELALLDPAQPGAEP